MSAPEVHALARVLEARFGRLPHVAERDALHVLNELGSQHWVLDRTNLGIRIDTAAELLAEELADFPLDPAAEAAHQKVAP